MKVLGVDPGIARTGVAVVEGKPGALRLLHAECVETHAGEETSARLALIFSALERALRRHRPDEAAVEELFMASNRRSVMLVGEARGVVLLALARARVPIAAYTPLQVKEAVAGYGAASKPQVKRMIQALLGVEGIPGPDDVADACAVAVCHHHRARSPEHAGGSVNGAHRLPSARRGASPQLAAAIAAAQGAALRARSVP